MYVDRRSDIPLSDDSQALLVEPIRGETQHEVMVNVLTEVKVRMVSRETTLCAVAINDYLLVLSLPDQ